MDEATKRFCTIMVGRQINRLSDLTEHEVVSLLNALVRRGVT